MAKITFSPGDGAPAEPSIALFEPPPFPEPRTEVADVFILADGIDIFRKKVHRTFTHALGPLGGR